MTYVVTDNCIKCKYMDCIEVCPVDCFYEGENMLVIHPDECIDCGVCEPECPPGAILPDSDDKATPWLALNTEYAAKWPNITRKGTPPPDADGDGVLDSDDNCPVNGNADQQDTGGDGVGDACETPPKADAQPGPGRTLVASFDGSAGPATTPVVCLNPCGSGNDSFATFEFRYELPAAVRYDSIEFILTSTTGTQYSMEIFGPSTDSLAFEGSDARDANVGGEPISDGELAVVLENPETGLYLIQVQEQLSGGSLPFQVEVYTNCPETGCAAASAAARTATPLANQSGAVGGALGGSLLLALMALAGLRRRLA